MVSVVIGLPVDDVGASFTFTLSMFITTFALGVRFFIFFAASFSLILRFFVLQGLLTRYVCITFVLTASHPAS